MSDSEKPYLHFPKWSNKVPVIVATVGGLLTVYVIVLLGYGANARTLNVGYAPVQPVPFSHELHADLLKASCSSPTANRGAAGDQTVFST